MAADENGGGGLTLQVRLAASLAAAGPLQCRYTRPPFNGAAAVKCFSAVFKFSVFFLRGFKQEQEYYRIAILVITYFYVSAADTGLELVERGLIKVLHFNYSKFLLSQLRNWALFSKR